MKNVSLLRHLVCAALLLSLCMPCAYGQTYYQPVRFITGLNNIPLRQPAGVATDNSGALYVVDTVTSRLLKFDSSGNLLFSSEQEAVVTGSSIRLSASQ